MTISNKLKTFIRSRYDFPIEMPEDAKAKKSDFLEYAKIFAASHHERWDGTGYPRGLKGNEIPLLGRIMAIADVYSALTSERPYRKAFTHEDAVRIITEGSGTQFDPALVEIFTRTAEQFRSLA
jgi:putative two-component system response regulator